MQILQKGTILKQFIGADTGIMFDMTHDSATLIFSISPLQLQQFEFGGHYDFWCRQFDNVIFLAVKLRDNPWAAAPFSPYLMQEPELPDYLPAGKGLPLFIFLVNNENGMIVNCDFLTLGNQFSNTLIRMSHSILESPFDPRKHRMTIQRVYQAYVTDNDLAQSPGCQYSID